MTRPIDRRLRRAGFQRHTFHTGEVLLDYVAGPPNGEPLVLVHGQSVTWEEYTFLMPLLAERFQVYAVTLRGHGRSTWLPGSYSFARLGADVAAFLTQVVGRPAVVVGNSSGGVLTAWLAANAPEHVRAVVLEDPPLFRCDEAGLRTTAVYDTWLAFSRAAVAGGGGYAYFFREHLLPNLRASAGVMDSKAPPRAVTAVLARVIALKQALAPGQPVDLRFLAPKMRIMVRGTSQFDGHFSRAFVDGSMGAGFDHAETLARIAQPVLFLHARWFVNPQGRLVGALDDADVARVASLVAGPWRYERMDCGHVVALDSPDEEAGLITRWYDEVVDVAPDA